MEIEVKVPRTEMKFIKYMKDYHFNEYLLSKLRALQLNLELASEEATEKKIEKTKKIIDIMRREFPKLKESYKKATKDKKKIEEWIDTLDKENERLIEMVKNDKGGN